MVYALIRKHFLKIFLEINLEFFENLEEMFLIWLKEDRKQMTLS